MCFIQFLKGPYFRITINDTIVGKIVLEMFLQNFMKVFWLFYLF